MTATFTAAWPVRLAVDTAFLASAPVAALVGQRIYSEGEVPQGTAMPVITYGSASETDRSAFGQAGATGTITLHIWAATQDEVHAIYAACHAAIHERRLPVTGSSVAVGMLSLDVMMSDPDPTAVRHHGVAFYRWMALSATGETA